MLCYNRSCMFSCELDFLFVCVLTSGCRDVKTYVTNGDCNTNIDLLLLLNINYFALMHMLGMVRDSRLYPHSSLGDTQGYSPVLYSSSTRANICCRMLFHSQCTLDLDRRDIGQNIHNERHAHRTCYRLQIEGN